MGSAWSECFFQGQIAAVHESISIKDGRVIIDESIYQEFPDFIRPHPHQPDGLSKLPIVDAYDELINNQWHARVAVRVTQKIAWGAYLAWLKNVADPDYYERVLKYFNQRRLP